MTSRVVFIFAFIGALASSFGCGGGTSGGSGGGTIPPVLACSDGGTAAARTVVMRCGGRLDDTTEEVDVVLGGPTTGTFSLRGLNFDVTYNPTKLEWVPTASYPSDLFPGAIILVTTASGPPGRLVVSVQQPGNLSPVTVSPGEHHVLSLSFSPVISTLFGPTPLAFDNAEATASTANITFVSGLVLAYQ